MIDDPTPEIDSARRAVVAAVVACLSVTDHGSLEFRRTRRVFDPTWTTLHREVSALAILLRQQGMPVDEAIVAVKSAILEGGPDLPPHNAIRAAAVGWCVAAFYGGTKGSI